MDLSVASVLDSCTCVVAGTAFSPHNAEGAQDNKIIANKAIAPVSFEMKFITMYRILRESGI